MREHWKRIGDRMQEGRLLFEGGEYDKAIVKFREVIADEPDYGDAWAYLSESLVLVGKKGEALQAYRKLYFGRNGRPLGMAATQVHTAMKAVIFFVEMRYLPEARTVYRHVVLDLPTLLSLGSDHPLLPNYKEVNPTARQLLAVAPLVRAFDRFKHQNYKEALVFCDEAVAAVRESALAHYYRGYCLRRLGREEEAHEELRQAIYYGGRDEEMKAFAEREAVRIDRGY